MKRNDRLAERMAGGRVGGGLAAWAVCRAVGSVAGRTGQPLARAAERLDRGLGLYLSERQRAGLAAALVCAAGAAGAATSVLAWRLSAGLRS
ncbi:MAG TPA: hypothetical protein VFL93_15585 [Longimicrobiaceae bacterium]|nr:hypothetical protein [Longimicrobiaceae bacterium]